MYFILNTYTYYYISSYSFVGQSEVGQNLLIYKHLACIHISTIGLVAVQNREPRSLWTA